jgi:putative transposase
MQVTEPGINFTKLIKSVKWNFTWNYKKAHAISTSLKLWQARFWDLIIRNEDDLSKHFDYIHWNPVKH